MASASLSFCISLNLPATLKQTSAQRCDEGACTQASAPKENDFVIFFPGFHSLLKFFTLIFPLLYFNQYLTTI